MTILEKENYRLQTVTSYFMDFPNDGNCSCIDAPISDGLAIEKRYKNSDSYYVICYIKYNKKECGTEIENIGTRLLDVEENEFKLFKDLLETARCLVNTANKKYSED